MRLFRPRLFRPHRERKVVSARLLRPHRGRKAVSALSRCAVFHLEYHICSGIVKKKYLHCNSRPIITNTTNSNCQSNVVNAILSPDRMMPLHTRGLGSGSDWTFVKFGLGLGPRRHVGRCLRPVEHQGACLRLTFIKWVDAVFIASPNQLFILHSSPVTILCHFGSSEIPIPHLIVWAGYISNV